MFTLPPRPPKDYRLEDVSLTQTSVAEHSPFALPRATQPNIGKFCSPVPADDNEPADKTQIEELNAQILEKYTNDAKAEWVYPPGKDDFFVHDVHRKYSVEVQSERDPRFHHRPRVLQRSYKYEFDCMEWERLKKLYKKMENEEREERESMRVAERRVEEKELIPDSCKKRPPFWWRQAVDEDEAKKFADSQPRPSQTVYQDSYSRWQPLPKITEELDHCQRREAFAQVRGFFRNEAANYYYKNYPPPNIVGRKEKFAK